jgi:hypothetical protein
MVREEFCLSIVVSGGSLIDLLFNPEDCDNLIALCGVKSRTLAFNLGCMFSERYGEEIKW